MKKEGEKKKEQDGIPGQMRLQVTGDGVWKMAGGARSGTSCVNGKEGSWDGSRGDGRDYEGYWGRGSICQGGCYRCETIAGGVGWSWE